MHGRVNWRIAGAALIACVFIGYLLFIDRPATKSHQAYVALDRRGPWGLTDPPWDGPDAVVLYRSGRNGVVCFDAFHSKELHDRLSSKNGQPVMAEYDTVSDFGKVRGYNVRSVDGMVLANGYHVLRPEFASSAGIVGNSNSTDDCWR
jgi:hypothetical protein